MIFLAERLSVAFCGYISVGKFLEISFYGPGHRLTAGTNSADQVHGMQAGVTFSLMANNGTVQMKLVECGTYIDSLDIQLHGGASWLYQW